MCRQSINQDLIKPIIKYVNDSPDHLVHNEKRKRYNIR